MLLGMIRKESVKAAARDFLLLAATTATIFFGGVAASDYFATTKKADNPSSPQMIFIQGGDSGKAFHVAKPIRGQETDSARAK